MIDLKNHFFSTYAKALIQDWKTIAAMIDKQSKLVKEAVHQKESEPTSLLFSDRQLNDAFNGPYQHFFKQHLSAYAKIRQIELALMITKGDVLKEKDIETDISHPVPKKLIDRLEFSDLKQYRESLDTLTQDHFTQWESHVLSWTESLISEMEKNQCPLSDLENYDILQNEPMSELNNRFIDFKLELPKLKSDALNFQQYFQLKATLAIHSALSRMHQANTKKEIQQVLEKLDAVLKNIRKTEHQLLKTHQDAILQLLRPITT